MIGLGIIASSTTAVTHADAIAVVRVVDWLLGGALA